MSRKRNWRSSLDTIDEESVHCVCSVKCGATVDLTNTTHYKLQCNHLLCPLCMNHLLTHHYHEPSIRCPGCNSSSNAYKLIQISFTGRNNRRQIKEENITIPPPPPIPSATCRPLHRTFDPVRYYANQSIDYQRKHMNISFSFEGIDNKIMTVTEDIPLDPSIQMSDRQQTVIEGFFQKLHTPVLHHDQREIKNITHDSRCYSSSSKLYNMTKNDNTLLRRLMNALGVGRLLSDTRQEEEDNKGDTNYEKRSRLSLSCAMILRQASQLKSTLLHDACSEILRIFNVSTKAHKFLNDFGLCSSRQQLYLNEMKKVHTLLENGYGFKFEERKWDYFITVYDNVGFRVRGAKCGYDQYIALQLLIISVERLKAAGFYQTDPSKPKIDRKRLNWEDVRKNCDAPYDIFEPAQHEYDELAYHHLTMIDEILRITNDLPTYDELKQLEQEARRKSVEWEKTRIKSEFGTRRPISEEEILVSSQVENDEVEDDVKTIYEKNGAEYFDTMHCDLNSRAAVKDLIRFSIETKNKALSPTMPRQNHTHDSYYMSLSCCPLQYSEPTLKGPFW